MITKFNDYSELPFSKEIQQELFNRHSHAEIEFEKSTGAIVYSEEDVLILMQMLSSEHRIGEMSRLFSTKSNDAWYDSLSSSTEVVKNIQLAVPTDEFVKCLQDWIAALFSENEKLIKQNNRLKKQLKKK